MPCKGYVIASIVLQYSLTEAFCAQPSDGICPELVASAQQEKHVWTMGNMSGLQGSRIFRPIYPTHTLPIAHPIPHLCLLPHPTHPYVPSHPPLYPNAGVVPWARAHMGPGPGPRLFTMDLFIKSRVLETMTCPRSNCTCIYVFQIWDQHTYK